MRQKRYFLFFVLAAVCATAVVTRHASAPPLPPSELPLLSKEVARIPSRHPCYAWQSKDTFLKFEGYPLCGMKCVDLRTGTETSLNSLEQRLGKVAAYRRFLISPDGKRALWEDNVGDRQGVRCTSLDASSPIYDTRIRDRFWAIASNPVWLPDSKRWIQLFAAQKGISASVSEAGKIATDKEIKIGSPKGTSSGFDLMRTHLLGCTQTGHILATPDEADRYENPRNTRHIDFFEFRLDSINPQVREYTIELPRAEDGYENNIALARDEEIELSPQGDRLAWLLHRRIETPVQDGLFRWLPERTATPHLYTELRITDLDGTRPRIIGSIECKQNRRTGSDERPSGMHWLPDGQHLSFITNGALWVLPAY